MPNTFIQIEAGAHGGAFGNNPMPTPTDAQCKAGNYKLGRITLAGMSIAVEQPRGTYRTGTGPDGKRWSSRMAAHYGYFAGTRGNDGDEVDCFVGFYPQSELAFVVNQNVGSRFDEHKVMLAFPDEESARRAYTDSYERGWPGLASIVPASISQLKWWLKNGDMTRPLKPENLPHEGLEAMTRRTQWNADALPYDQTLDQVLYDIRRSDGGDGLLLDSVSAADILEDSDGAYILDAMVVPMAGLERKMAAMQRVMGIAARAVKPESDPAKAAAEAERAKKAPTPVAVETEQLSIGGKAHVTALFRLSDGQTIVIYFHNPDATPRKIAPTDELISWRWLLNKRDVTAVVAPERGEDLNVNEVARRIMKLAEKNSPAFVRANGKRAERMQHLASLNTEIAGLEVELKAAQNELEAVKIEAEDRAALSAPVMMSYFSTTKYKDISLDIKNAPAEDALDAYNSLMERSDTGGYPGSAKWREGKALADKAEKIAELRPDVLALRKKIADDKREARLAASSEYAPAPVPATQPTAKYAIGQRVMFKPYPFASGEKGAQVADGEITRAQSFEESTTSGMTGAKSSKILFTYTIRLDSGLVREQIDEEYVVGLADGATAAPVDALLHTFPGDDNMQAEVRSRPDGKFGVILRDLDSGNPVSVVAVLNVEEKAIAYAKSLVAADDDFLPDGRESKVKTAKGTEVVAGFAVVEADRLITSHDPASGDVNPEFPQELQPRDRGRETSRAWVLKTAANLDPEQLGKTRRADTGAPIVGKDRVVESGNGRTMAIMEAYRIGKAGEYRAWLEFEADYFGLSVEKVKGMKRPVLVRVRTSQVNRAEFAVEANQDDKLAMTATEKARADANRLTDDMIGLMTDNGDLNAAANTRFLSAFLASLGDAEAAQYSTSEGKPTSSLIARVQAAIFAKAYNDDRLLELTADSAKPEIANIISALNFAAPEFIQSAALDPLTAGDATKKLTDAIEASLNSQAVAAIIGATNVIKQAKESGMQVDEFIKQQGLFGDLDPSVAAMAVFISKNNRSAKRMGAAFKAMATFVKSEIERRQTTDMFGEPVPIGFPEIIAAANRELDRAFGEGAFAIETVDLFARPVEPVAVPAVPAPAPAPTPKEDPQMTSDRALFQSVIDGTVTTPDGEGMLSAALADTLEAAYMRHAGNPEMDDLFEKAINAYTDAEVAASANL